MQANRQNITTDFVWVTLGHSLVIGILLVLPLIRGCDSAMTDMTKPMELIVAPPPSDSQNPIPADLVKDPAPAKDDEKIEEKKIETPPDKDDVPLLDKQKDKEKKKTPEIKPKDNKKPEPKSNKIKISNKIVKRPLPNGKGTLTPEEVRELLKRGAKLGNKPSLSDANIRHLLAGDSKFGDGSPISQEFVVLDMVRQALYRAWDQPTDIGIAGLVTKVELTFTSDGSIVSSRLLASSGNKTMDASVMRAVQSVRRVNGLPASFLSSHRRIPVSFELTGNL